MASPAVIFFGGVATVVVALGVGFGGALMLTSTEPIHKEPAAAFAKRDAARPEAQSVAVAAQSDSPQPPAQADESLVPKSATTVEDIAALNYAPPQAAPMRPPTLDPAAVAPEPTTTGSAPVSDSAAPIEANTTEGEKSKIKSDPKQKDETASTSAIPRKTSEKSQKAKIQREPNYTDRRRVLAEKEAGERRRLFTERRRRVVDDDGERVSSTERDLNQGEGFFGFLFGQ